MNLSKWNSLDWALIGSRIQRIQVRIYIAAKGGNTGSVTFLQDLLINSYDAKLLAIQHVTTLSSGRKTPGVDKLTYLTDEEKITLALNIEIDGRAAPIRQVMIPKPGRTEKRPLGIPIILDRVKQRLVLMALEPEWESRFEPNSYGFRPSRGCHDAIEAIFRSARVSEAIPRKYVLDADLKGCFNNIRHDCILLKLNCSPIILAQVKAWLQAGIFLGKFLPDNEYDSITPNELGTPQGGVISPFLANVALHGMESFLKDWIVTQTWDVGTRRHQLYKENKIKSISIIRYADDFVVIHQAKEIVEAAYEALKTWLLQKTGLSFNTDKTQIRDIYSGFDFLGFSIIRLVRNNKPRIKIYPSSKSNLSIVKKVGDICRKYRSISAYDLVKALRPTMIGWANYYKYSECQEVFSSIDFRIFPALRAWAFRRDRRNNASFVKEKYFPTGLTTVFQGRTYNDNWILRGQSLNKKGICEENFLPRMAWVQSQKFISVLGTSSPYDGNTSYWKKRFYDFGISKSAQALLRRQKGICPCCKWAITDDRIQTDHVIPRYAGGSSKNDNLQILHVWCHIRKTASDLIKYPKPLKKRPTVTSKRHKVIDIPEDGFTVDA